MSIWRRDPHRLGYSGLSAFYLNGMLRSLVFALIGIFTPLFIYRQTMVLYGDVRLSIAAVALFYLVTRLTVLISAIPVSRMIERIGFRRSVLVSIILLGLYLVSLKLAIHQNFFLWWAPVLGGLSIPWYWIARDSVISQDGARGSVGIQMGWMMSVEQTATILGPLAAGLIIAQWGFGVLYSCGLLILLLSVLPLFYMPHHTHRNGASLRGFGYWIADRRYFHQAVGVAGRAVDDYAIAVVWPLAIYLMGWHTGSLGALFSFVALTSLAVRLAGGAWFDRLHRRRDQSDEAVFATVSLLTSITWVIRSVITGIRGIFALDLLGSLVGTLYGSMYTNYVHLGGMRMGSIAYWVYAEMVYSLSTILMMSVMIGGAWVGVWKEAVFLLASLWVLLGIVQARESNI